MHWFCRIAELELQMFRLFSLGALIFAAVLGLSGCAERPVRLQTEHRTAYTTREDSVSIDLLASRLGLRVDSVNSTHITLKNSTNTVITSAARVIGWQLDLSSMLPCCVRRR